MNDRNPFAEEPRDFPTPPQKANTSTTVIIVIAVIGGILFLGCGGIAVMGVYMVKRTTDQFEQIAAEMEYTEAEPEPYSSPTHS